MNGTNFRFAGLALVFVLVALLGPKLSLSLPVLTIGEIANQESIASVSLNDDFRAQAMLTAVSDSSDSVFFVGDVLLARNIEKLMKKKSVDYPFKGLDFNDYSKRSLVVGNFEASIPATHLPTKAGEIRFSVDRGLLSSANKFGFTHFSLANNHSYDSGELGFENTKTNLAQSGYVIFGQPNDLSGESVSYIEFENTTISLIGIKSIEEELSQEELEEVFLHAKSRSDVQIAYVHWGVEYDDVHSEKQEKLAKQLVVAGADLIIGHHPHVVQDVALVDGVLVFYSLGNYIFDQYFSKETQEGLVLRFNAVSEPYLELMTVTREMVLSQPRLMDARDTFSFLDDLSRRSDARLSKYIRQGIVPLDTSVATSSKMAIMSQ